MSPADDLFDIIEPENDNSSETENDFVQDENFIESLGFKDMEDDVDAVLDEAVDSAGAAADDVASEIDNITDAVDDAAVDTAENIDNLVLYQSDWVQVAFCYGFCRQGDINFFCLVAVL